jgi:isopentenyl-diphosphate Delta-isomerase
MTEMVVLCTSDGQPSGVMPKSQVHHQENPLHLAFSCYLFDFASRFLFTRRAAGKKTWPGVDTNSCCGHPAPSEPLPVAIEHRVRQELGLTITKLKLVLPRFAYRFLQPHWVAEARKQGLEPLRRTVPLSDDFPTE